MREWPWLAAEIFDIRDLNAGFFKGFSLYGGLERFTGLDEACDEAVHSGGKAGLPRHEDLRSILHEDDDGGRDFGKIVVIAMGAVLRTLAFCQGQRFSAFGAKLVCPIPVLDLECRACCIEYRLIDVAVQTSYGDECVSFGLGSGRSELGGGAGTIAQPSQRLSADDVLCDADHRVHAWDIVSLWAGRFGFADE